MARKLHAPKGTDEVNSGSKAYRVDNSGDVVVPDDAVGPLLSVGGCTLADEPAPVVPQGFTRMIHEDDAAVPTWGGASYEKQADGAYHVPVAAVHDLLSHGFILADSE